MEKKTETTGIIRAYRDYIGYSILGLLHAIAAQAEIQAVLDSGLRRVHDHGACQDRTANKSILVQQRASISSELKAGCYGTSSFQECFFPGAGFLLIGSGRAHAV